MKRNGSYSDLVDLHTHSTFSDGTLTPTQLITLAKETGLSAVALCDHNTVAGLPEFLTAAETHGIKAVPGVELSTEYTGVELHILGLFLSTTAYAPVTAAVEGMLARKEKSNIALCDALTQAGMPLDYAAIKAGTPKGQVNRAVIAADMVKKGYCDSVKEAFDRWLDPERGYYLPPRRLDAFEAILLLKSVGAVAVLAHPFLNLSGEELEAFLPQAVAAGLDGMETEYPKFDAGTTALARTLADRFGLLHSGGSDFHGANKPDIRLGYGRGELRVPAEILRGLEERRMAGAGPKKNF